MRRGRQGDERGFSARRELRSRVGSRVPAHPTGPGAGHRAPGLRPRFAHPTRGVLRAVMMLPSVADALENPIRLKTQPQLGGGCQPAGCSSALPPFPKCGKKINPTLSSKPPSFAPQEASQRNVSCSGKHHLIGKPPAKGEKVFTSRSLCDGVARRQLTFPFAQPCGCCGVDTI